MTCLFEMCKQVLTGILRTGVSGKRCGRVFDIKIWHSIGTPHGFCYRPDFIKLTLIHVVIFTCIHITWGQVLEAPPIATT